MGPDERLTHVLDFEKPIIELEVRLAKLRALTAAHPELAAQATQLEWQVDRLRRETFARLTRWQIVQLARHPHRPSPLDYVERLAPDLYELHGDRAFQDDPAILGGPATLGGRAVMVIAHARGRTADEQRERRWGMTRPEGLRKAVRLARLAERLDLPVVTFIDTPGAWPGADAEERGQALAIATSLEAFASLRTPVVACVVGEGGSGGALALSVSDRLLMQEYAVFAVISPEACSSILYRNGDHAPESAEALKLTARDLSGLGLVDELVREPPGGAHRDVERAAKLVGERLTAALDELSALSPQVRADARYRRIRAYGSIALLPEATS